MAKDIISDLWSFMNDEGFKFSMDNEDAFRESLRDDGKKRKVYQALKGRGLTDDTEDEFVKNIGKAYSSATNVQQKTAAVNQGAQRQRYNNAANSMLFGAYNQAAQMGAQNGAQRSATVQQNTMKVQENVERAANYNRGKSAMTNAEVETNEQLMSPQGMNVNGYNVRTDLVRQTPEVVSPETAEAMYGKQFDHDMLTNAPQVSDDFHRDIEPLMEQLYGEANSEFLRKQMEDESMLSPTDDLGRMSAARRNLRETVDAENIVKGVQEHVINEYSEKMRNTETTQEYVRLRHELNARLEQYQAMMVDYLVKRNTPQDTAEYWVKNLINSSVILSAASKIGSSKLERQTQAEGLASYDAPAWAKVTSGVVGMAFDAPLFQWGSSAVAPLTRNIISNMGKRLLVSEGAIATELKAEQMATRALMTRGGTMVQRALPSAASFGGYALFSYPVQTYAQGGDYSVWEHAKSILTESVKGAAFGMYGGYAADATKTLSGSKRLAAKGGAFLGEVGMFTAFDGIEQLLHGVKFRDIAWGESFTDQMAFIGGLKAQHVLGSTAKMVVGTKASEWKSIPQRFVAEWTQPDVKEVNGTLWLRNNRKLFTDNDYRELAEFGVDARSLQHLYGNLVASKTKMEAALKKDANGETLLDIYDKVMNSPKASVGLKSKLMFLMEGTVGVREPIACSFGISKSGDGKGAWLQTFGANGEVVTSEYFANEESARRAASERNIGNNTAVGNMLTLMRDVDQAIVAQNEASICREIGVSVEEMANIKSKRRGELTEDEKVTLARFENAYKEMYESGELQKTTSDMYGLDAYMEAYREGRCTDEQSANARYISAEIERRADQMAADEDLKAWALGGSADAAQTDIYATAAKYANERRNAERNAVVEVALSDGRKASLIRGDIYDPTSELVVKLEDGTIMQTTSNERAENVHVDAMEGENVKSVEEAAAEQARAKSIETLKVCQEVTLLEDGDPLTSGADGRKMLNRGRVVDVDKENGRIVVEALVDGQPTGVRKTLTMEEAKNYISTAKYGECYYADKEGTPFMIHEFEDGHVVVADMDGKGVKVYGNVEEARADGYEIVDDRRANTNENANLNENEAPQPQPQRAIDKLPMKKNGKTHDFVNAEPTDVADALVELAKGDHEKAKKIAENLVAMYTKDLEAAKQRAEKGVTPTKDPEAATAAEAKLQEEVEAAQRIVDHFNEVRNMIEDMERDPERMMDNINANVNENENGNANEVGDREVEQARQLADAIGFAFGTKAMNENGSENYKKREIWLNEAHKKGVDAWRTILGHELTHAIKDVNSGEGGNLILWRELRKHVMDAMGEEWERKIAECDALYNGEKYHLGLDRHAIEEEVISDWIGENLFEAEPERVKALIDKVSKNNGNAEGFLSTIVNALDRCLETVRKVFGVESEQAVAVEMAKRTWENMYEYAARLEKERVEKIIAEERGKVEELKEPGERIKARGGQVNETKGDTKLSVGFILRGKERENAINDLMKVTGRDRETCDRYIKQEESLANIILDDDNVAFLDLQADDSVPSIWNNSDYPQGTVEFSNICRKRLPLTMVYQRLQKEFPNTIFDAKTLETIRGVMKADGVDVACGLCFVEDRRQLIGEIGDQFIRSLKGEEGVYVNANQQKVFERLKASGDDYIPQLYEIITLDGMRVLRKEHPQVAEAFVSYNAARGQQSARLFEAYSEYKREILKYDAKKVKKINDAGGLRIFSFSDFEAHHLIDLVQVITDCATKGIKVQCYTKVPEFAKAFKDTNAKINRSLIPLGKGFHEMPDGSYVLDFDPVEGINVDDPNFFDATDNPNVGNILVGISDQHIRLAMLDDFVDYIIPFHTGIKGEVLKQKGIGDWTNYKMVQHDKVMVDGKLKNSKIDVNIYTEVLDRAEKEGRPIKNKREFVEFFLEVCKEQGIVPRFEQFLDKDADGNYVYTEGYHKLLIDFKLFDKDGNILPQKAVVPEFDADFNKQILENYVKGEKEGGNYATEEQFQHVRDELMKQGKLGDGNKPSPNGGGSPSADGTKFSATRYDKEGNPIGDGSRHEAYDVIDFSKDYPQIKSRVSESNTSESSYVTYSANGKTAKVRFSTHMNNGVRFGEEINGRSALAPYEVLEKLGLIETKVEPIKEPTIKTRDIAQKNLDNYEEADLTLDELKALPIGSDISEYVGKRAKGSNKLIEGDVVGEREDGRFKYYNVDGEWKSAAELLAKPSDKSEGTGGDGYEKFSIKKFTDFTEDDKLNRKEKLESTQRETMIKNSIVSTQEKSARRVAEDWAKKEFPQPIEYNNEVGNVVIDINSVKDSLAHGYSQSKLDALTTLKHGFNNAVYLGSLEDFNGNEIINHYFAYPVVYDGEFGYVLCRARQDNNLNRLYIHEVYYEKEVKGHSLQTRASAKEGELPRGTSLYKHILSDILSAGKGTNNSSTDQTNDAKLSLKRETTDTRSDEQVKADVDKYFPEDKIELGGKYEKIGYADYKGSAYMKWNQLFNPLMNYVGRTDAEANPTPWNNKNGNVTDVRVTSKSNADRTPTIFDYYQDTEATFKPVVDEVEGESKIQRMRRIRDTWEEMKASDKYLHHKSPYKGSRSEYLVDRETGDVYRFSNHWGDVASCKWNLEGDKGNNDMEIGVCNIADFKDFTRDYHTFLSDSYSDGYLKALDKTIRNYEWVLNGGKELGEGVRERMQDALDSYYLLRENIVNERENGEPNKRDSQVYDNDTRIKYSLPEDASPMEQIMHGLKEREDDVDNKRREEDMRLLNNRLAEELMVAAERIRRAHDMDDDALVDQRTSDAFTAAQEAADIATREGAKNMRAARRDEARFRDELQTEITRITKRLISGMDGVGQKELNELLAEMRDVQKAKTTRNLVAITQRIMDTVLNARERKAKEFLDKALKVRGKGISASGGNAMKSMDEAHAKTIEGLRKRISINMGTEELTEEKNRLLAQKSEMDETELTDVQKAKLDEVNRQLNEIALYETYRMSVSDYDANIRSLKQELAEAETHEQSQAIREAIIEERTKKLKAIGEFIVNLKKFGVEGALGKRNFLMERQAMEDEVNHAVNSDTKGLPVDVEANDGFAWFGGLSTLNGIMKFFGRRAADGKGRLWHMFIPAHQEAIETRQLGLEHANEMLNAISKEYGYKTWSDMGKHAKGNSGTLYRIEPKREGKKLVLDEEGKSIYERKAYTMTLDNLLYIHACEKMSDGRMKLRKMGITEAEVERIRDWFMEDPKRKALMEAIDRCQNDVLSSLKDKYNVTHRKLFGVAMSDVEDYFPLRLDKRSVNTDEQVGGNNGSVMPSTMTGAIKKRVRNSLPLDITGTGAFEVVLSHILEMETWNAFAPLKERANMLLNNKNLKHAVDSMKGIYGSGQTLLDTLKDNLEVATECYKPKNSSLSKIALAFQSGITLRNIAYNLNTARKQLTSIWAELGYADPVHILRNVFRMPLGNYFWAMENLPSLRARIDDADMGYHELKEMDKTANAFKVLDKLRAVGRVGMIPNKMIDVWVCAHVARACYDTQLAYYKKSGLSQEVAERKAKTDAEIAFNETQQSSQGAFLSELQSRHSIGSTMLTTYRNSPMSYQRVGVDASRNLRRQLTNRSEMIEQRKNMWLEQGVDEKKALENAKRDYLRGYCQNVGQLAAVFTMNLAWYLSPTLAYMAFGKDDEKKKEMAKNAFWLGLTDDFVQGIPGFGPAANSFVGNVLKKGGTMKNVFESAWNGDWKAFQGATDNIFPSLLLFEEVGDSMDNIFSGEITKMALGVSNHLGAIGFGASPKVVGNIVNGVINACKYDMDKSKKWLFGIMSVMSHPKDAQEQIFVDLVLDALGDDYAERVEESEDGKVSVKGMEQTNEYYDEIRRAWIEFNRGRDLGLFGIGYDAEKTEEDAMEAVENASEEDGSHALAQRWATSKKSEERAIKRLQKLINERNALHVERDEE